MLRRLISQIMESYALGGLQNTEISSLQMQAFQPQSSNGNAININLQQVLALAENLHHADEMEKWKLNNKQNGENEKLIMTNPTENGYLPAKTFPLPLQYVEQHPTNYVLTSDQSHLPNEHFVTNGTWPNVPTETQQSTNLNSQVVQAFLWIEAKLCAKFKLLEFGERVAHVYNPLEYASDLHAHYISKFCGTKSVMFLGMNPGPFGMAQNGVPFGDTHFVRDWLQISGDVNRPQNEHPKRPIQGLQCTRNEVSGSRFWGLMSKLCGTPEQFFQHCFVHNYCPLVFLTKTGKNIIPPSLPSNYRHELERICDDALLQCIRVVRAQIIVAIGKYAEDRVMSVLQNNGDESSSSIRVVRILHPSPASPQANSGWDAIALSQLQEHGVLSYLQPST